MVLLVALCVAVNVATLALCVGLYIKMRRVDGILQAFGRYVRDTVGVTRERWPVVRNYERRRRVDEVEI